MAMSYVGMMYFPLNVNFFEDGPIELIEAKYGLTGIAVVMKLLCKLYKENGYYLQWGEEQCMLFAHKAGIAGECMEGIVRILLEKGFFDRQRYKDCHILTSVTIQKIWLEATKRRKKDKAAYIYLADELKQESGMQNKEPDSVQPVNILPENADNSEQSKAKERKAKESKAEQEGGSPAEDALLSPPGYAYNKQTHNYEGLLFTLQQMHITVPEEVNSILRLSDYGRLKGYVWQVIHSTRWKEVAAKGKYLIAALAKEKRRS